MSNVEGSVAEVLAIAASARRHGNSEVLLEKALEPLREAGLSVEKLVPYELSITPCRSCLGCWETGRCVVQDEMQELYVRFCEVDHVVVASPIYFTSLPGHFKVLIDRFQCLWVRTYRLGQPPQPPRIGMFLGVGAMDRQRYFKSCLTIVRTWMSTLNMRCAVSRFYPGLDEKCAAQKREDYLKDALEAGRELLQLAQ